MSGASDFLDPIEAARGDIHRSKHLIASTLDDLSQHHSWLESYHREERRRADRLRRQEALHRLQRKRQRAVWRLRRFAVTSYAVTRAIAVFSFKNGKAFLIWARPRARALAAHSARLASAGLSWSWHWTGVLAREGFDAATIGFAWSVRASEDAGIAFRRQLSDCFTRLSAEVEVRTAPARRRAAIGWTRMRRRAQRYVIAWEARLVVSVMRAALHIRRSLEARTLVTSSLEHRALIVRPCTALACIAPLRARLPVVRTG